MWSHRLDNLQPLPLLQKLELELPLCDPEHLSNCFASPQKVWPSLVHLGIDMLHRDTTIESAVFSVLALPRLQTLSFMGDIKIDEGAHNEWHCLFVKGEVWPEMRHLAVSTDRYFLLLDRIMFPAAKLELVDPY